MAQWVKGAFRDGKHLVVEAGTGVGKSFAYLIPAIYYSIGTGEKVVISTNTISLQEQLVEKDLPFLQSALPVPFKAVLVKGRGNYLCLRRLTRASHRKKQLFAGARALAELQRLEGWAYQTADGTKSDLDFPIGADLWSKVCSDSTLCRGANCEQQEKCFFQRARKRMSTANLLVVNHHMFFSDFQLRRQEVKVLPAFRTAIFDEAHALESVAAEHLGLQISSSRVR
jgi:ATP-dependent DNA helicase DinG